MKKQVKIISQKVRTDEFGQWLIIKYSDGSVSNKLLTAEEAAKEQGKNKY